MAKITQKQIARVSEKCAFYMFIIILIFAAFDILSTYAGVCKLGGIELSISAIRIINSIGFLPFSLIYYVLALSIALIFYTHIRKQKYPILKAAWSLLMCLVVLEFVPMVINNSENLFLMLIDAPPDELGDSYAVRNNQLYQQPGYLETVVKEFDREKFCMLLPQSG